MPLNPPASGWQRKKRGLIGSDLLFPLLGLFIIMLSLLSGSIALFYFPDNHTTIIIFEIMLAVLASRLFYITQSRIQQNLLEPLSHLRHWALRMRNGNLSAQIPIPDHGEFAILARDINELGESLRTLSREMDDEVNKQTEKLAQKTHYLEILYDVASNSSTTTDITELLIRYLGMINSIIDADLATIRLHTNDNRFRLIGSIGFANEINPDEQITPVEHCLCAQNFTDNLYICDTPSKYCQNLLPITLDEEHEYSVIAIPLQYHKTTLGIYHCFVSNDVTTVSKEQNSLLVNIAQHLSLAIEKDRLEDESKRMSIMQERTMLAHELHDSLAQTLASLRFRISMLVKMLKSSNDETAKEEAQQIKGGLDEANNELRELLAHFRVPMDERGLVHATQSLVERFKVETRISVFFQNECPDLKLPSVIEVQLLHIIQESLANARKHAKCENVRILLRKLSNDKYRLLVEDDGIGIETVFTEAQPGEHVGLSIMQERARRIDGELNIESEPGEGTRVELEFYYNRNIDNKNKRVTDRPIGTF